MWLACRGMRDTSTMSTGVNAADPLKEAMALRQACSFFGYLAPRQFLTRTQTTADFHRLSMVFTEFSVILRVHPHP